MESDMELMESLDRLEISSSRKQKLNLNSTVLKPYLPFDDTWRLKEHSKAQQTFKLRFRLIKRAVRNSNIFQKIQNDFKGRKFMLNCNDKIIIGTMHLAYRCKVPKRERNSLDAPELHMHIKDCRQKVCAKLKVYRKITQNSKKNKCVKEESYIIKEPQQQSTESNQSQTDFNDLIIDELSSYFDSIMYIPKKMSTMAEQMYT